VSKSDRHVWKENPKEEIFDEEEVVSSEGGRLVG
jgi:hypothetical protein